MHSSKVQHSTIKQSPSLVKFGYIDTQAGLSPSKTTAAMAQNTPSKTRNSLHQHLTSPSFDFSFERAETDLSAEAQKIMDSVRGEAAKIKAQLMEERSKQLKEDGETRQLFGVGGRKINKPKGKAGRYSEIHKQEFKKMDSIVNHASVWKAKETIASSLKRSPSKAGLDQPDKPLQRTKSFKSFGQHESSDRLENDAPAKRAKRNDGDDTSAARPISRDATSSVQTTPAKVQPTISLPSAVTTPTKASLARSASVRSMKTSMIPSISRSASTKTLNAPKTEGSNKYLSSLARFGNMKSILHRAQPKFSNDPTKIAAGTHLPLPEGSTSIEKDLPNLPVAASPGLHRSPAIKRVNFNLTPSGKSRNNLTIDSSSPSKIPTPYTNPQPQSEVSTSPPVDTDSASADSISYPNLANSPNITTRAKIPRAATPGDFTFRTEHSIDFSLPKPPTAVTSPGSTIRHVRPSGVPTKVPNFDEMPAIPHGMPNKKRSRPEPDTEAEDEENVDPMDTQPDNDEGREEGRSAKKVRLSVLPEKVQQSPLKKRVGRVSVNHNLKNGTPKKKGLSLGRLNMLARPKERH